MSSYIIVILIFICIVIVLIVINSIKDIYTLVSLEIIELKNKDWVVKINQFDDKYELPYINSKQKRICIHNGVDPKLILHMLRYQNSIDIHKDNFIHTNDKLQVNLREIEELLRGEDNECS